MNKEMVALAIAYSVIVSNKLSDAQQATLNKYGIDYATLEEYKRRINTNSLTLAEQDMLEKMFNIDLSGLNRFNAESNSNTNSNTNTKAKAYTLTNGKKQFGTYDEAAFSDIYMFAFLVLLFQVLFLIISYMIFAK